MSDTLMFTGHVQSPIEYYLTGNRKEYFIRQTHLLLLWVFLGKSNYLTLLRPIMSSTLAGVTFFMSISRLELKTYMRRQRSFRSHIPNPQVKNTVTFKTLTYEIFLLGMLSTLFLLSHDTDNVSESNNTYILIVLNLINIVSNIFLLTYLITNHEAFEYTKKKYAQYYCKTFGSNSAKGFFRRNGNTTSAINQIPNSIQIFTIRTPRITDSSGAKRESLVKFNNDIELIELESCSHSQ